MASRPYQITWWKQQDSTVLQELNSFLQLRISSTFSSYLKKNMHAFAPLKYELYFLEY